MNANRILDLHELLNRALKTSEFPWWEWEIPTNRVRFNDLKATMLGYDPADFRDVGYQAFTALLHPDDYEATMQAMRDHLDGKAPIYQTDYRIRNAAGQWQWYMDRGCTLARDGEKRPLRLRGIVLDLGAEFSTARRDEVLFPLVRRAIRNGRESDAPITICSVCMQLKLSEMQWVPLSEKLRDQMQRRISHGICPDCLHTLYPEDADAILAELGS